MSRACCCCSMKVSWEAARTAHRNTLPQCRLAMALPKRENESVWEERKCERKSRQIQPSMHCHHSSRASSRQAPFHTQYGSVSKDGNPCQMPEISKAKVERQPWSGLAVLRPAGILSAASEAVGDGGCLCQWHSWDILECIWKQSRCQAILWLLQCPPASFHLQHQLGSRHLVHHTLSWSKSSASCLSHPTVSLPRPAREHRPATGLHHAVQ